MDQSSGSTPLQELATQTEINPSELNVPHKPYHFLTKKVAIFGIVFLIIVFFSIAGTYYVMQMEQVESNRKVQPTPVTSKATISPTPTSTLLQKQGIESKKGITTTDPQTGWTVYTDEQLRFSISYPKTSFEYGLNCGGKENKVCISVVWYPNHRRLNSTLFTTAYLSEKSQLSSTSKLVSYYDILGETIKRSKIQIDQTDAEDVYGLPQGFAYSRNIFIARGDSAYQIIFLDFTNGDRKEYLKVVKTFKILDTDTTCIPRPPCLDSEPRCMIPETDEMCPKPTPTPMGDNQVVCTMDAKQCPDGSFVGRTGPNCEFAACPGN